jgi:hypothetical protein
MVRGDAGRRRETRRQLGCGCGRAHGARGQVSVPLEPHGARPGAGAAAVARAWAHNGHTGPRQEVVGDGGSGQSAVDDLGGVRHDERWQWREGGTRAAEPFCLRFS